MKYYSISPPAALRNYVRCFWVLEGDVSSAQPYIHRTLASYCPELIFHYKGRFEELCAGDQQQLSFLTGLHAQTSQFRRFIIKENFGIFGVYLEPYAIPALLGMPAHAVIDELPDLHSLLGQEGRDLEEQVLLATTDQQRVQLVSAFLEKRIRHIEQPGIIDAIRVIYQHKGQVNCKELAARTCLSQRQFERRFKELAGFSPKLFARIVRFNMLLTSPVKAQSLTQLAYEYGYYDQAHFIEDFKSFSGYNPRTYFSGKAPETIYSGGQPAVD
jgi:AraC-like DNA-binding protein